MPIVKIAAYFIFLNLVAFIFANRVNKYENKSSLNFSWLKISLKYFLIIFICVFAILSAFEMQLPLIFFISPIVYVWLYYRLIKTNKFLFYDSLIPVLLASFQKLLIYVGELYGSFLGDIISIIGGIVKTTLPSIVNFAIPETSLTVLPFTLITLINIFTIEKVKRISFDSLTFQIISYLTIAGAVLVSVKRELLFETFDKNSFFLAIGLVIIAAIVWNIKSIILPKILNIKDLTYNIIVKTGLIPLFVFALGSLGSFVLMQILLRFTGVISSIRYTNSVMGFYEFFFQYFYVTSATVLLPLFYSIQQEMMLFQNSSLQIKIKYFVVNMLFMGILFSYVLYWYLSAKGYL